MQCANNIRQLALAVHNFHDTFGQFPSARRQQKGLNGAERADGDDINRIGGLTMLLPFVEQTQVWSRVVALVEEAIRRNDRGWAAPWNEITANPPDAGTLGQTPPHNQERRPGGSLNAWNNKIPSFRCPSDGYNRNDRNPTNYRMNGGDVFMTVCWNDGNIGPRGVFANGVLQVSTMAVPDGTSNTMMFAEGIIGVDGSTTVATGVAVRPCRTWDDRPVAPIEMLAAKGPNNALVGEVYNGSEMPGSRWGDGRAPFSVVFTVLPPNSPTVRYNEEWTWVSPSSRHPGGVATVACDAAYRFVNDSVNTTTQGIPRNPSDRTELGLSLAIDWIANVTDVKRYSGPSPYGTWGAYGSAQGGDSAAF